MRDGDELPPSGRAVRLGRWLLLVLAAAALIVAALAARQSRAGATAAQTGYACPMHPAATGHTPGICSVCGMALERMAGASIDRLTPTTSPDGQSLTFPLSTGNTHHLMVQSAWTIALAAQPMEAPAFVGDDGDLRAVMFGDEAATLVRDASPVTFVPEDLPGSRVEVRPLPDDGGPARFRAVAPGTKPHPGTVGRLRFILPARKALVIPSGALIESPSGPYVLASSTDSRTFTVRPVDVGRAYPAFVVVLAGLKDGDHLAPMGVFFLDAERRLRAGAPGRTLTKDQARP